MTLSLRALGLAALFASSLAAAQFVFEDATAQLGLSEPLKTWRVAHGIAVGDCTGDGLPELYLGAFADRPLYLNPGGPLPNMLFLNDNGHFRLAPVGEVNLVGKRARTTMALFADLNNDGRLDLIAGNHKNGECYRSVLFENLGEGRFRDATPEPPEWLATASPRNISVLDFNHDGLLDLIVTDGGYGDYEKRRLHILQNNGNWTFTDVSEHYGFPTGNTVGMGLAIGDVNNDGAQDIFVAHSNRLFVSGRDGKYRLFDDQGLFIRERKGDWWPCGASFGDLNGDDLLDLVIAVHGQPAMVFVYLNQGIKDGMPQFTELRSVTFPSDSPTTKSPIKCAQVTIRDMDNNGTMDIALCVLSTDQDNRPVPFILRNLGNNKDRVPQMEVPPVDRAMYYYAPGAFVDWDRDGRMDVILPSWFNESPNLALRNVTPGGNWLLVQVKGVKPGFNPMGIGAIIRAYPAGKAGQVKQQLARYDLTIGNGYSSGEEAIAHLGLGKAAECDLVITWHGERRIIRRVKANQFLTVEFTTVK
ncbi:MAG: CRTAC1 family protein [Armatimonadota bacterium]